MQMYSFPEEVDYEPEYTGSFDEWQKREEDPKARLIKWLKENDFNGPNTGKIYYTPRGDGSAMYMIAHATHGSGRKSGLMHLPYGDAWDCPNIQYIPQKVIFESVNQPSIADMLAKHKEST